MANYAKTNIENEGRVELHETRSQLFFIALFSLSVLYLIVYLIAFETKYTVAAKMIIKSFLCTQPLHPTLHNLQTLAVMSHGILIHTSRYPCPNNTFHQYMHTGQAIAVRV